MYVYLRQIPNGWTDDSAFDEIILYCLGMIRMIHGVLVAFGAWACLSFAPESMNEENSLNLS